MDNLLEITTKTRVLYVKFLTEIPIEKLVEIPAGFNNNIWWNAAHVAVTQQLLVYKLSGLEPHLSEAFINAYRKGSVPDTNYVPTQEEVDRLKASLIELIARTKADLGLGVFKAYQPYLTSAGVTLNNVTDAMTFNLVHEGMHIGSILALKKALGI